MQYSVRHRRRLRPTTGPHGMSVPAAPRAQASAEVVPVVPVAPVVAEGSGMLRIPVIEIVPARFRSDRSR